MGSEKLLWRLHFRKFLRSFEGGSLLRATLFVILAVTMLGVMSGFYWLGSAVTTENNTVLLSLNVALFVIIGFFAGVSPTKNRPAITQLPISERAIQWDGIIASMRYVILISLIMTAPYYVGQSSDGYYSFWEMALLILSISVVSASCYLAANAAAQILKSFTRNSFVRFIAMASILVLLLEFFARSNQAIDALEKTFNSISSGEALLVIFAAIGVIGAAVTAIEALKPAVVKRQSPFWNLMSRHRNFSSSQSLGESVFIGELLFFLRHTTTHFRIAVTLILFLAGQAVSTSLLDTPWLHFLVFGGSVGLVTYFISFASARRFRATVVAFSNLPTSSRPIYWANFIASGMITLLIASALAQLTIGSLETSQPLGLFVLMLVAFSGHAMAFNAGVRLKDGNDNATLIDEGIGALLIVFSIIFALVILPFLENALPAEVMTVSIMWTLAYFLISVTLLRASRVTS